MIARVWHGYTRSERADAYEVGFITVMLRGRVSNQETDPSRLMISITVFLLRPTLRPTRR